MGNGHKKLIRLMEYKAKCLEREIGIDPAQYFSDMDRDALQRLPDEKAAKLAAHLATRVKAWMGTSNPPSDIATLPFCWVWRCGACPYGKTHGKCHEDDLNDYDFIRNALQSKYGKEVVLINEVCRSQTMLKLLKFGSSA